MSTPEEWNVADIVENFNKQVKKCLTLVSKAAKYSTQSQALLDTARRRIKMVSDVDDFFLIQHIGKYLFEYREVIHENLDDFILHPDKYILSQHRKEAEDSSKEFSKDQVAAMDNMLKLLQEQWNGYTKSEKSVVRKMVQTMLSEYCKYSTIMIARKN